MKACEKWQNFLIIEDPSYSNLFTQKAYEIGQREGWKAALEEVLNHLDHSEEHTQIADWIHDELES